MQRPRSRSRRRPQRPSGDAGAQPPHQAGQHPPFPPYPPGQDPGRPFEQPHGYPPQHEPAPRSPVPPADARAFEQPPETPRGPRPGRPSRRFGHPAGPPSDDAPPPTTTEGFEDELDRAFAGARRNRVVGLAVGGVALVLAAVLGVAALVAWNPGGTDSASAAPHPSGEGAPKASASAPPSAAPTTSAPPYIPENGNGKFTVAAGSGVTGEGTKVMRYMVAVEGGLKQDVNDFAKEVDDILGDPRGWTAQGKWAFQRVDSGAHEFVVKLSSPGTTDKLCGAYGMDTEGEVNCRAGKQVVVNLKRWLLLTKYYKGRPHEYHALTINHEVGHRLGLGHMTCGGKGKPAPVMMQQIYGLKGCTANPWPYDENGVYIKGPAVP
ncbi:DUF3152 domain-containing protein [Spirillospora sp. NPDC052242]